MGSGRHHPPRARIDASREVLQVMMEGLDVEGVLLCLTDDGRHAIVSDVIRATSLVQDQIPIDPTLSAGTQVLDDIRRVPVCGFPAEVILADAVFAKLLAGLSKEEMLFRTEISDHPNVIKADLGTHLVIPRLVLNMLEHHRHRARPVLIAPITIPMKGDTPNPFGSCRIRIHNRGVLYHAIAIVIPDQYFRVSQTLLLKGWSQVVSDKIAHFLSSVNAGLPLLTGLALILH
mmetsp:Transcript_24474/g.53364  ORF Transcript_24474/g.53364 Transcript_24474/m.53364 type:complete len:232 (-) Transcript_24474:988-1683(-)